MVMEPYDIGPIRPPSEAGSLLIRVNRNCPWNKCEFCHVYKGQKFEKKSVEEVKQDIDAAARVYGAGAGRVSRAFLQDANAVLMKTPDLVEVIKYLKEKGKELQPSILKKESSILIFYRRILEVSTPSNYQILICFLILCPLLRW